MLVSSVIIFLMIYSVDPDRERDAHKLEMVEGAERDIYLLLFPDTEQRLYDQWLSVAEGQSLSWSMPACWPTSGWDGSADLLAPFLPE